MVYKSVPFFSQLPMCYFVNNPFKPTAASTPKTAYHYFNMQFTTGFAVAMAFANGANAIFYLSREACVTPQACPAVVSFFLFFFSSLVSLFPLQLQRHAHHLRTPTAKT